MDVPIIKLDDAHKHLLDRDGAMAMAMAANFQDAIDLVNKLINYGTNWLFEHLQAATEI